jgi:hypothetical protein
MLSYLSVIANCFSVRTKGLFEVDVVDRDSQRAEIALLHLGKPGELSVDLPPDELVE